MKFKILTLSALLVILLGITACAAKTTPAPAPTATLPPTATPTQAPPTATVAPQPTATPPPTATPGPSPTPEPSATFEKASCPFQLPADQVEGETIECGYLVVPEDRADPDSREVRLAVAIFHPPGGAVDPDPIIYLSGGPGGSALELIYLSFEKVSPVLAANRDLVIFDQRGVGRSEPALDCPALIELSRELLDRELDGQQLTDQELFDLSLETILACQEDLIAVADLSAYNTAANAADVNDLRLALGYDEVNLWGASYGTRLALGVMRDYPAGVRSVVLDSVYPPDVDLYLEGPANVDRAFSVLFESCAADTACNATYPDLRTVFFDTVDRLNENPADIEITNAFTGEKYDAVFGGDTLLALLFQLLYETDVVSSLPQLIYDASQDNLDMSKLILGSLIAQQGAMSLGMQFSVQCNEEFAFNSLEEFETVLAGYPELTRLYEDSAVGKLAFQVCAAWDSGTAEAVENEPVSSDIPTLVLAGEYDPITPPSWARHAAETLDNSHFFEYPGVGHGASLSDDCPRGMMIAFLDDPITAPDDACIAEMDMQFYVPSETVETVEFEPFTDKEMGISGVAPVGWTEVVPGTYGRGSSGLDVTALVMQAAPVSADDLLGVLTTQLSLDETPESAGEREANGLTWALYAVKVRGVSVDFALAEAEELTLIVMLQSSGDERDALYEIVFLPAVDALAPLE